MSDLEQDTPLRIAVPNKGSLSEATTQMLREAGETEDFEGAMNAVRRLHREQVFRIGIHTITGRSDAEAAGLKVRTRDLTAGAVNADEAIPF